MKRKYRLIKSKIVEGFDSMGEFADAVDIDNSLLSHILAGNRKISQVEANKWFKVLSEEGVVFNKNILKQITKP